MVDEEKRKFVTGFLIGAVFSGVGSSVGSKILEGSVAFVDGITSDAAPSNIDLFQSLFGRHVGVIQSFAGDKNLLAVSQGKEGISPYLLKSSKMFSGFITKSAGLTPVKIDWNKEQNVQEYLNYDSGATGLFLGGPIANPITRNLVGYKKTIYYVLDENGKQEKNLTLPFYDKSFNHVRKVRWVFNLGESFVLGQFDNNVISASRYDRDNPDIINRPVYAVEDLKEKKRLLPKVNSFGELESEFLLIMRVKENGSYKVNIGGMFGYSIEAFVQNLEESLIEVHKITQDLDEYQVLVPVRVSTKFTSKGIYETHGALEWDQAKAQSL